MSQERLDFIQGLSLGLRHDQGDEEAGHHAEHAERPVARKVADSDGQAGVELGHQEGEHPDRGARQAGGQALDVVREHLADKHPRDGAPAGGEHEHVDADEDHRRPGDTGHVVEQALLWTGTWTLIYRDGGVGHVALAKSAPGRRSRAQAGPCRPP